MSRQPARQPLGEWFRHAVLKPAAPDAAAQTAPRRRSVEELEAAERSLDDKERLIGLIAAPFAAAITVLVVGALIADDPASRLRDGLANPAHVSVSLYHDVAAVLVVLSVLMLAFSLWRKRLYLGVVTALYGLAVFNLHYWGFGIPYVLCAAWLLVRAYRVQRDLKEARGLPAGRRAAYAAAGRGGTRPAASKRYTAPGSSGASAASARRRARARRS